MSLKNFVQQLTRLDWAGFKTANEGGAKLHSMVSLWDREKLITITK